MGIIAAFRPPFQEIKRVRKILFAEKLEKPQIPASMPYAEEQVLLEELARCHRPMAPAVPRGQKGQEI